MLQLTHVGAMEVGKPEVQRPVAHPVRLVHERHPCGGVHFVAKRHPVVQAKVRHGGGGGDAIRLGRTFLLVYAIVDGA